MQFPIRIQPQRPTIRTRRSDPRVLAFRTQLEALSTAELRQLEDELHQFEVTGVAGSHLAGVLSTDASANGVEQQVAA